LNISTDYIPCKNKNKKRGRTQTMLKRRVYIMDEKGLIQNASNTLRTNKQKTLDIIASVDELKKEHEPEYVFLYWDELR
jgi:peroxiredoxin